MGQSTSTQGRSAYADGAVQRRGMAEMGGVQTSSSSAGHRRPQAQQQQQSQEQSAAATTTSAQDTVGRSYPESGSVATLPPYPGPATTTSTSSQQQQHIES